jgi:hypothetical protein
MSGMLLIVTIRIVPVLILGYVLYRLVWRELIRPRVKHTLPAVTCPVCDAVDVIFRDEKLYLEGNDLIVITYQECMRCHTLSQHADRIALLQPEREQIARGHWPFPWRLRSTKKTTAHSSQNEDDEATSQSAASTLQPPHTRRYQ